MHISKVGLRGTVLVWDLSAGPPRKVLTRGGGDSTEMATNVWLLRDLLVVEMAKARKCSLAGHLARMDSGEMANRILHTRSLTWWRHIQSKNQAHGRRGGDQPHPKRFCAHARWESPFEDLWGVHSSPDATDVVGWMLAAQDREKWQQSCRKYVCN